MLDEKIREEVLKKWASNRMQIPRIKGVHLNICVGESGDPLSRAVKVLQMLTGQKPSIRIAKRTIRGFGIHKGEKIACLVTVRGEKAFKVLDRLANAVGRKISESSFDREGNFGFGIKEHIDIPGVKYDPEIGIIGMNVYVSLEKPGYRVKKRRVKKSKIGKNQKLTREEAMIYAIEKLGLVLE